MYNAVLALTGLGPVVVAAYSFDLYIGCPFWASIGRATKGFCRVPLWGLNPDALGLGLHCRPCLDRVQVAASRFVFF